MINKTVIRDVIKSRKTRFVTVTFRTKAGEQRKVNGMFMPPNDAQIKHWLQPMKDVHTGRVVSFYLTDVEVIA